MLKVAFDQSDPVLARKTLAVIRGIAEELKIQTNAGKRDRFYVDALIKAVERVEALKWVEGK